MLRPPRPRPSPPPERHCSRPPLAPPTPFPPHSSPPPAPPPTLHARARPGEIAAVDLNTGTLVWRHTVPSHGLINIVAAPQLGEASTYRAMSAAPAGTVGADAATTTTTTAAADAATSSKKGAAAKAVVGDEGAGPADAKAEALPGITDPGVIAATSKIVAMGYKWVNGAV